MTRDEFIKMLTDNFKADEQITFLYDDDDGESRAVKAEIENHTETQIVKSHYEVKDREGNLEKFDKLIDVYAFLTANMLTRDVIRFVSDEKKTDTVKVIHIS